MAMTMREKMQEKREVSRGREFCFVFFFFSFLLFFIFSQAREAAKSGLVLFLEAMDDLNPYRDLKRPFERFERAAAKGHATSIWITSLVNDMELENSIVKEAFAVTEEPMGYYFAGSLSGRGSREKFDFYKKSAEGGCSWGQAAYGGYFNRGEFVEKDPKAHVKWLEKAANQNNPRAMYWLGLWYQKDGGDNEKAVLYFRTSAKLGWKGSMVWLARMLECGEGCGKDLSQAAMWNAKGMNLQMFCKVLREAFDGFQSGTLDCEFNRLCYWLGWGMYWYIYGTEGLDWRNSALQNFANGCIDFYCATLQLQQESIFTFLLFWNRTVGVKDVGALIGKMVWEEDRSVWVKRLWRN
jgi:hypothetical protein